MAISREEIEALVEEIVHGAEEEYVAKLTEAMIEEFARGLDYSGAMDLQTLLRRFPSKASSILLEYKGKISDEVYSKIEEALKQAAAEDLTSLAAIYGQVKVAEGASRHFETLSKQTAHGITKIIERQNVAMSQSLNMTWYKVAGDAVTAVNSGLVPRSKALADGVVKLVNAGITVVPYVKNGRATVTNHVDVALRRHLTTQVSQAGGRMSLEAMDLYNHELVITDAHYGARPTHAEWQGLPACRTGRKVVDGVEYPGLGELTGYGDVGGLKGANCRHMIFAYYPGISKLPDREFRRLKKQFGMTSDEYYAATQRQRELERRIRKTKREIAGMEQAGLGLENPAYVQKRLVLGKQQTMIKKHCEKMGLVRIYEREKAYGVMKQPRALSGKTFKTKKHYAYPRASEQLLGGVSFPKADRELINALQRASDIAVSDMPENEIEALIEYTTGSHNLINQRLYGVSQEEAKRKTADEYIASLDRSMGRFNLDTDVAVFSGTDARHYSHFEAGNEYTIDGFLSTSVRHKDAKKFFDGEADDGNEPLLLRISVPKGTKCLFVGDNTGYFEYQGEMILARGLKYRVIERKGYVMYMEVVSNV